ncbi:hypothetical protein AB6V29_05670 [Microbacterium sp. 20-116]|uniref:hypothetical protein n=1 Tax=unclassified Microbacterium TaxID=2609290 RepID=UPI00226DFEB8|nr:hypothetical protein [Microbacterium sp. SL75]WAC69462.1 hypothetical protein OVA17_01850 [Microbacterium sp. SL75]
MDIPADRLPGADEENLVPESDGLAADVPAGAAGADSGAVGTARIDPDDEARLQGISSQNDLPGVGTRAADGMTERGTDEARREGGSTSRHTEDTGRPEPQPHDDTQDGAIRTPASPPRSKDGGEPHVDGDDPIARFQPGVGRDSAASSKIAQSLPHPDDA